MKVRKIIYIATATLIIIAVIAGVYLFLVSNVKKASSGNPASNPRGSTMPKSLYSSDVVESQIQKGQQAQDKGDIGEALRYYKAAAKLCDDKDKSCKINSSIKIKEMQMAQEAAAKRKTKNAS